MGKNRKNKRSQSAPNTTPKASPPPGGGLKPGLLIGAAILLLAGVVWGVVSLRNDSDNPTPPAPQTQPNPYAHQTPSIGVPEMLQRPNPEPIDYASLPTMEINQAVMVTVELDFGPNVPSIAEALTQIERRSIDANGRDRTFAILDAYGNPTEDGKLHISMHVSTEKPGIGALVFKRTDEFLWHTRITPSTNSATFSKKDLTILISDGEGRSFTIDGSNNPNSILDANVKQLQVPLREIWKEDQEREMTFIYSACGCPVKVMCRRQGEVTVRTKEMPVIFPDDPAVVQVITRLMGW